MPKSPCITCSVLWEVLSNLVVFSTVGGGGIMMHMDGYLEYCGGCSVPCGGYHEYRGGGGYLEYCWEYYNQGCHLPDNMKFPDFFRPRLSSTVSPRPFRGSGDMLPQKMFKIRNFNLAENEFQTTKFSDFSLTFGIMSQIP